MGAVLCFVLFLAAVALCLLEGWSLIAAIWAGILFFGLLGLRKGFSIKAMASAAWAQGRKMCCVIVIYMLIGAITALWRSAGTIAFFIYHGLRIITPQLFLLVTFLLTSFISYALGTSFGVVGTLGVILMALARSGGVSVAIPLAMLGADMSAIPYEILLYAIPLCYWLTKRRVYPPKGDDCYDTIAEPLAHS